jgi:hypothetical protein
MNEQDIRGLVREAIERHLGRPQLVEGRSSIVDRRSSIVDRQEKLTFSDHASHILLKVVPGSQIDDGMCVIEPAVRCNHCGFCQSYGH